MLSTPESIVFSNKGKSEHFVRFYDEDAVLLAEVADFIDAVLRIGGSGIIIATPEHISDLERRLAGIGAEPGHQHWSCQKLFILDAQESLDQFMVNGWPDEARFDAVIGQLVRTAAATGGAVRAFGEMVALLCAQGSFDAALRLEEMWKALAAETSFSLFCAYPWKLFPTAELFSTFQKVCKAHDHVCSPDKHATEAESGNSDFRLAELEQKARALEAEVARRKEAEQTLKLHERELADFLENSAEGLHRVGADGSILWANKAELNMLGYPWEEYVGRHIAEFHVDAPVIEDILTKLKAGQTLYDYPARLRCKDGSVKHVMIHSNGCFEDGELRYTRCFTRDATERYERDQAHAEREKLLAELSEANHAKDEFLAMLGHEMRNPLAPISMALELMRMRGDDTTRYEREIIGRQVEHMSRLVDDLLDISRITRGRVELQIREIRIANVVTKAIEMASPLLEQRNHQLKVDIDQGLCMNGDPVRLAQVVANLLNNAARYTADGGQIALTASRESEDWLRISVKDNGAGMPEHVLAKIFNLFYQGKQNIDRAQGGLGIGLAIVKSITELHGGTAEARSRGVGHGSEFILRLPLHSPSASLPDLAPVRSVDAEASTCKRRILLVDDNVDAAATLGKLLESNGHQVAVFSDPVAALSAVQRVKPDVAILDIGLPVLSGYELAVQLRAAMGSQPCQLIALTGYGQEADKAKSRSAGFEHHLVKPINPKQIIGLLNVTDDR